MSTYNLVILQYSGWFKMIHSALHKFLHNFRAAARNLAVRRVVCLFSSWSNLLTFSLGEDLEWLSSIGWISLRLISL